MTIPEGTTRRIVIDHVDLLVRDLEASRDFYRRALAPLGFHEMDRGETFSVYGVEGSADFAIDLIAPGDQPTSSAHVAFVADSRRAVDAFFHAALTAGAREKQAPAERPGEAGAGRAPGVPRGVLQRLRLRPRRQQHRGRLPRAPPRGPTMNGSGPGTMPRRRCFPWRAWVQNDVIPRERAVS